MFTSSQNNDKGKDDSGDTFRNYDDSSVIEDVEDSNNLFHDEYSSPVTQPPRQHTGNNRSFNDKFRATQTNKIQQNLLHKVNEEIKQSKSRGESEWTILS